MRPRFYPRPGNLIKCLREGFLYCTEQFKPHMANNNYFTSETGDVMMYLDRAYYDKKSYYKVLFVNKIYFIRSDAFKHDRTRIKTRKTSTHKKSRV